MLHCGVLMGMFPGTVPTLMYMRPYANEYYPVSTAMNGTDVIWTPSAADCEKEGSGTAQIRFVNDDGSVIGMSQTIDIEVLESIEGIEVEDMPDPVWPWVDPLLAAAAQSVHGAERAEQAAEDAEDALHELLDGIESGEFDGFSPSAKVERIDRGARITVTDRDGTTTADVLDSQGGGYDDTEIRKELGELKEDKADQADLAKKLDKPTSGIAVGKYFRVAAVDELGNPVLEAVDLPKATVDLLGCVTVDSTNPETGIRISDTSGVHNRIALNPASTSRIDSKTGNMAITPPNIDRAIRSGLLSNSQITDADYPAIHKTLGIEKEWVLKGTLTTENKDTGVAVDLTGCTEMIIAGTGSATSDTLLETNGGNNLIYAPLSSSNKKFYARFVDGYLGFECIFAGRHSSQTGSFVSSGLTSYCSVNGMKISNINRLVFGYGKENVTECNIQIYAR